MNDPLIHPITIVFTHDFITIEDNPPSPPSLSGHYLKIQIIPTDNGKDIQSIIICYSDPNGEPSRLHEEISDDNIFKSLVSSMKGYESNLLDKAVVYMKALPSDEVSVIVKEYTKYIQDGVVLDGFIAGIAAYIAFNVLNENSVFTNQMPFQFGLPWNIYSGNIVNRNMFQHLSLPLLSLSKIAKNVLLQLVLFIQSFINIWEPIFHDGPTIGSTNEARLCVEIISGLSQHVTSSLVQTQSLNESVSRELQSVETRIQASVDTAIAKMSREVNNLLIDTRGIIKEIATSSMDQLTFIDDSIRSNVSKIVMTELDSQIKNKIQIEVESASERIGEIVRDYTQNEGMKLTRNIVDDRESELGKTLVGLEHRIEVLYDKLEFNNLNMYSRMSKDLSENIIDNNDGTNISFSDATDVRSISSISDISLPVSNATDVNSTIGDASLPVSDPTDNSGNVPDRIYTETNKRINVRRSDAGKNVNIDTNRSFSSTLQSRSNRITLTPWSQ